MDGRLLYKHSLQSEKCNNVCMYVMNVLLNVSYHHTET